MCIVLLLDTVRWSQSAKSLTTVNSVQVSAGTVAAGVAAAARSKAPCAYAVSWDACMELHGARQAEFCRPHFVVGPFALVPPALYAIHSFKAPTAAAGAESCAHIPGHRRCNSCDTPPGPLTVLQSHVLGNCERRILAIPLQLVSRHSFVAPRRQARATRDKQPSAGPSGLTASSKSRQVVHQGRSKQLLAQGSSALEARSGKILIRHEHGAHVHQQPPTAPCP